MITTFDIYLVGNIDNFISSIQFCAFLFIIISCGRFFCAAINESGFSFLSLFIFIFGIIFVFLSSVIPSSRTLASMIVIPPLVDSVSKNKDIQKIPKAVLDLIKSYENNEGDKK